MFLKLFVFVVFVGERVSSVVRDVVEEPGIVTLMTDGNVSAIRTFSHDQVQQLQLPASFQSTSQVCTNWLCPRPNLDLVYTNGELIVVSLSESVICLTKQQVLDSETSSGTTSSAVLSLSSFLADTSTACTFLGSINSPEIYVVYCLQITSLYSCVLHVNSTEVAQSYFICEWQTSLSPSSDPHRIASNFVLGDRFQIFFWYDDYLFRIKYRVGVINTIVNEPHLCNRVVYADETLYHYCDNSSAIMTDSGGTVIGRRSLAGTGIPFPCAGTHTSFTVRQGPNDTEVAYNGGQIIPTNGTNFHDAACILDASNTPLLLLIDRTEGFFMINSSTMILYHFPEACSGNRSCQNLIVYPGSYIAVMSSGGVATPSKVSVYDAKHLELLRQEILPDGVTRVGVYTILRTDSPTFSSTVKSIEASESTTSEVTGVDVDAISRTISPTSLSTVKSVEETESTTSTLTRSPSRSPQPIVVIVVLIVVLIVGIVTVIIGVVVAVIIIRKSFKWIHPKFKTPKPPASPTVPEKTGVVCQEQDSQGTAGEPVIGPVPAPAPGTHDNTGFHGDTRTPPDQPSRYQVLKAEDAHHGYQLTEPGLPTQCT